MRDLQHDNVNGFVGACIEPPNVCALSEYCTRGSLKVNITIRPTYHFKADIVILKLEVALFQDILENEDIKLDNMFIASLVGDIIRVSNNLK